MADDSPQFPLARSQGSLDQDENQGETRPVERAMESTASYGRPRGSEPNTALTSVPRVAQFDDGSLLTGPPRQAGSPVASSSRGTPQEAREFNLPTSCSSSSSQSSSSSVRQAEEALYQMSLNEKRPKQEHRGRLVKDNHDVVQILDVGLGPDQNALVKNWRNLGSMYGIENHQMNYIADCSPKTKVQEMLNLREFEGYTMEQLEVDLHELQRSDILQRL